MNGVTYVINSHNGKLSNDNSVDATYVSMKSSCPKSCAIKGECYAKQGFCNYTATRLDNETNVSALEIARFEAKAIDEIEKPNKYLRLHVMGDSRTIKGSCLINSAVKRWISRGGEICWSYTHCWQNIPRSIWNNVSMLASIDSIDQIDQARKQGYVPALVVPEHLNAKPYMLNGVKWIPCPSQIKGIHCSECKLCFKANLLFENNNGIAFAAHGIKKNFIKKRLKVI
jgi:hypothetical protein